MTKRRNFLKKSLAAAAGAIIAPHLHASGAAPEAPIMDERSGQLMLSVLSYSFHGLRRRGMMDIFHFMETCKYRYQLNTADLWSGHLDSLDDEYIMKVKEALDERELFIPNIACDGPHVLGRTAEETESNYKLAWRYLEAARKLGKVGFVRIDSGPPIREQLEWTDEEFDFMVNRYREYAQFAYDNGFKAGAENHMGPSRYWPSMKKLVQAVDHPGFGICNHIGGWHGTDEEKDRGDRESAPYTVHTHIAWNITEGPLVEKLTYLRDAGYPGYYSVEHHTARFELARTAIQLAKVRAVLLNWAAGGDGSFTSR